MSKQPDPDFPFPDLIDAWKDSQPSAPSGRIFQRVDSDPSPSDTNAPDQSRALRPLPIADG